MNYNIVLYGRTNNLNNIFQSGTTAGSSGFKQTNADLNTLYAPYTTGYKTYFTQEFLGNTTTIPPFPFKIAGVSMGTLYNFKPSFFFTVTGNDATLTHSNTTGYNYSLRFIASGGTINFKTDTIAYLVMVGGGGGGGRNNGSTPRGAGGGGGGSLNTLNFPMKNNITYTFTIGGGGSGSVNDGTRGGNGFATSMSWTMGTSYTISARGGGGGGAGGSPAHAGGSGGGACASAAAGSANSTPVITNGPISYSYTNNIISGQNTSGIPIIGSFSGTFTNGSSTNVGSYAYSGGTATNNGGGGGGGAGEAGTGSAGAPGGAGGDGVSILGVATVGGGGGGGSGSGSIVGGAGGSGGGGRGSNNGEGGVAGTANTGGGGGGSDNTSGNGGAGGSGVVYVFF
jgi:hypothetical protein